MRSPTVPAVQPWTCHPQDHHLTRHLTHLRRRADTKAAGRKQEGEERMESGQRMIKGKEEQSARTEANVLHQRNPNLSKMILRIIGY